MADDTTVEMTDDTQPTPTPTPEELRAELDRARTALKKANSEAADRRKKLDAFEKAEADKRAAELSEADRLKAERDSLNATLTAAQTELRTARVTHVVELEALALGFHDADDALRPEVLEAVTIDDAGKVDRASAKKALKALLEAKPHLGRAANSLVPGGTPPRRGTSPRPDPQAPERGEIDNHRALLGTGRYGM